MGRVWLTWVIYELNVDSRVTHFKIGPQNLNPHPMQVNLN